MRRVWLLAVLAACRPTSADDEFPVSPGGPTGIGSTIDGAVAIDAASSDAITSTIIGRVCLVRDLRATASCAATGAGNITVTLGHSVTITSDSGAFTIQTPSGTNLVWRAAGSGFITSVMAFGPSPVIPIISDVDYIDLALANGIELPADAGSIVANVVRNGLAVSGATIAVAPLAQFPTKYDGPTASAWTELATGATGTAWIAGAVLGAATLTVSPASGTGANVTVPVEDQAITYVTLDLP